MANNLLFLLLSFSYVVSAVLSFRLTSSHTYIFIANLAAVIFSFLLLVVIRKGFFFSYRMLVLFLICLSSILSTMKSGLSWSFVFYVYFFVALVCFYNIRKPFSEYTRLILFFYFFLVVLAVLNYSFNDFLLGDREANFFEISFLSYNIKTIYGFEGSTAHIDSISAIAALIGIFYYKGLKRVAIVSLSLLIVVWTDRYTPIVILFLGVLSIIIPRKVFIRLGVLGVGVFLLIGSIHIYSQLPGVASTEINREELVGIEKNIESYLRKGTHGRIEIWASQYVKMKESYSATDYLVGNRTAAEVPIRWSSGVTKNPHNSFINLFIYSGFISVMFFSWCFIYASKYLNKREFSLFLAIVVAAMTNSEVLYPSNPIFILIFSVLLSTSMLRMRQYS